MTSEHSTTTTPVREPRRRSSLVRWIVLASILLLAIVLFKPLMAWFTLEPLGESASAPATAQAGSLSIEARIAPDPPRQSDNNLWITAKDPSGEAVEGAEVSVVYSMPAMGTMPEMRGEADVSSRGDRYRADFDLPMGGTWTLEVGIRSEKGSGTARYTMTVGSAGLVPVGAEAAPAPQAASPFRFEDPVLEQVASAFEPYEEARAHLAADELGGARTAARRIEGALGSARAKLESAPADVAECLRLAAQAAAQLASATAIGEARASFAEVSRYLMAMAAADPRLQAGWHPFECPMIPGFARWFQRSPAPENPYRSDMDECASPTAWLSSIRAQT